MSMKIITINLPEKYLAAIQLLQDNGDYPSRSEAIRIALSDFLEAELEFNSVVETMDGLIIPEYQYSKIQWNLVMVLRGRGYLSYKELIGLIGYNTHLLSYQLQKLAKDGIVEKSYKKGKIGTGRPIVYWKLVEEAE